MPEYRYALHDFEPENLDEIPFRAGERIEVVEKDDIYSDGWWQGRNISGAVGLFPQSYTSTVAPTPVITLQPPINDIHTPTTLHSLREEPENSSVQDSPNPEAVSNGAGLNRNDEVMKATMTDVQKAIEQLGKGDADGARSFSFASSREGDWTDREVYSDNETDGDTDAEGETWHSNARQKLAHKARLANQKAGVDQTTPRRSAPPIEVELSDESEGGEDEDHHRPRSGSPFPRHHPHIPEEDENETQSALKPPDQHSEHKVPIPIAISGELVIAAEEDLPTATADRGPFTQERSRSPVPENNGVSLPTPTSPSTFNTDMPTAAVKDNVEQSRPSSSSVVSPVESQDSQTTPSYTTNGLPSPTASSITSVGIQQTLTPAATASPLKSPTHLRPDSSTPLIPKTLYSEWTVEDVVEWLKSKGFDEPTCDKFVEQEITGDVLLELNVDLLKTEIGIPAFGKRKRIANCIEELKKPIIGSPQMTNSESMFSHSRTMSSAQQSLNSPSFFSTPAPVSALGSQFIPAALSPESPPRTGDIPGTPEHFKRDRRGSDPGSVNGSLIEMIRANSRNSIIGLGIGFSGKSQKGRPANLSLYPSDGALSAKAISVDNVITLDDRTAFSENEAPTTANSKNSKSKRRRAFGRSLESNASKDNKDSPGRDSKEGTPLLHSPSKQGSLEDAPVRHRAKKSTDGTRPTDRLSLFGNTFSGTLGKSRKPAPRYSSSVGEKSDNEKEKPEKSSSMGTLSKLYHYGDRKVSSHRPATSDGNGQSKDFFRKDSKAEKESKEAKDEKDRTLLRKRTSTGDSPHVATVAGASGLTPGLSVLEQIGTPDYTGWLHKKGESYNAWKQRYFVLKGPHLYWLRSNSKTETKIKGYINVAGYKIIPDENIRPGSYGFKMTHDQDKILYFSSEAQVVVREWMKALVKSTIDRDYTKPVVSSVNISTIPLTVAQAMSPPPRPPSPTARAAMQKALRRPNPTQLSSRDAQILLMGVVPNAETREDGDHPRIESYFANDTVPSPVEPSPVQTPTSPKAKAPPRPSREMRRRDSDNNYGPIDDGLIEWANSHLPPALRIQDTSGSICGGLTLLRLAESIRGKPSSPPVSDASFPIDPNDDKLDGLFRLFDFLLDNDVRLGSVSINDVRQGKRDKIVQLLRALKAWDDKMKAIALSIGNSSMQTYPPLVCATGGMPWISM